MGGFTAGGKGFTAGKGHGRSGGHDRNGGHNWMVTGIKLNNYFNPINDGLLCLYLIVCIHTRQIFHCSGVREASAIEGRARGTYPGRQLAARSPPEDDAAAEAAPLRRLRVERQPHSHRGADGDDGVRGQERGKQVGEWKESTARFEFSNSVNRKKVQID